MSETNDTKQQLELTVSADFESRIPKEIPCNIEEVIRRLDEEVLPKYLSRIYGNDELAEARADHATLKRWVDTVESARKSYEKLYMKPFKEFKDKLKLATDRVLEAAEKVNEQIASIEGAKKSRNEDFCRDYFDSVIGDLIGLISFEQIADAKWYNLSVKDADRTKAIDEKLAKIRGDLALIDQLNVPDKDLLRVFYLRELDLPKVTTFVNGITRDKDRITEFYAPNKAVTAQNPSGREIIQAGDKVSQNENFEATFVIRFEVNATKAQLNRLKRFLEEEGIEYRPIDKQTKAKRKTTKKGE